MSCAFGQSNSLGSILEHNCAMNIDEKPKTIRLTGIVCTIGPASREVPKLVQLIKAGMVIARMNFSHGTHEYHKGTIDNVRKAVQQVSKELGIPNYPIAIALDTKGPEIRTGVLEGGATAEVVLEKGKTVKVTTDDSFKEKCSAQVIHVDYKNITKVLSPDNHIFIDDGLISLLVKEKGDNFLNCEVENGGKLGSKKGVNLPGAKVDLPAVSEKDKEDLLFGVKNNVDMVFASFIRNANGVNEIRNILNQSTGAQKSDKDTKDSKNVKSNKDSKKDVNKSANKDSKDNKQMGKEILIISKIENHEGVQKVDEIIAASDGVMVARGDMGIEIPAQQVPLAQKMMISKCNIAGKPVICATQMLESMTNNPRPTRAEVSDVANAVWDGSDCVMLSGESAKGKYPIEAVNVMSRTCLMAEMTFFTDRFVKELKLKCGTNSPLDSAAAAIVEESVKSGAAAILVSSSSENLVFVVAKYRPRCAVIGIFNDERIARQSRLVRGLLPLLSDKPAADGWEKEAIEFGKKWGCLKSGDSVVVVSGHPKDIKKTIQKI